MLRRNIKNSTTHISGALKKIKRSHVAGFVSVAFVMSMLMGNIFTNLASAYGQVQSRSIELSNSAIGSLTAGQNVSYSVSFLPATTGTIGGIDIDFCTDPIIGDTCTVPTGFTTTASPTIGALTGFSTSTGSWGITVNGAHNLAFITNATAQTESGTSTAITVTISGITNPTTVGAFYARILTYNTQTNANAYTSGSTPGTGIVDAGGIALSTVNQITITSKVQEQLTFCVYTSAADAGACSGTGTTVTLGNTNGILSTAQSYVDNTTKYDIQTNALHGGSIRVYGTPPTNASSGNVLEANTANAMGGSAGTASSSSAGTTQFGLCTWASGGTTANLTPSSPYNNSNCNTTTDTAGAGSGASTGAGTAQFDYDVTATSTTYGQAIATYAAGAYAIGQIAFIGNISVSQSPGIYTTILTFIATGSY